MVLILVAEMVKSRYPRADARGYLPGRSPPDRCRPCGPDNPIPPEGPGPPSGSFTPNRDEQTVRYYGHDSNILRGKRQQDGSEEAPPCILELQRDEKIFRRNRARLIQKIYEADLLFCLKCKSLMRIKSSIEDLSVIRTILAHLGLRRKSKAAAGNPCTANPRIRRCRSPSPNTR